MYTLTPLPPSQKLYIVRVGREIFSLGLITQPKHRPNTHIPCSSAHYHVRAGAGGEQT
jgi:hypothetical protein